MFIKKKKLYLKLLRRLSSYRQTVFASFREFNDDCPGWSHLYVTLKM